jgi:hypothetical protein
MVIKGVKLKKELLKLNIMSAYEGSKMQERDEENKKSYLSHIKINKGETTKEKAEQRLHDAIMQKMDIPFEQQAEKKMQVYEAARRMELPAFIEWMFDKKYFIGKL